MAAITLSWTEFLKESEEFLQLSKKLNDDWEFFKKNDNEGNTFLSCKKKVRIKKQCKPESNNEDLDNLSEPIGDIATYSTTENEVLLMEYHIVYSISYQVPVLYIKVQRSDGSMLEMEEIWQIFGTNEEDENINTKTRTDMLTVLTQMEHPVLFKPFYAIHPCRTAELLGQTPKSQNRVLTFISLMGPYVKLYLDNRYGFEGGRDVSKDAILKV